jgi:hypothetical protein
MTQSASRRDAPCGARLSAMPHTGIHCSLSRRQRSRPPTAALPSRQRGEGAEASTPANGADRLVNVWAARPGPHPTSRSALAFANSGRPRTLS